jgi:hypothetical protein
MATGKLFGQDDISPSGYGSPDYISTAKFIALATGNVTEFRIKSANNSHVNVGIYADSGGEPGALLNKVDGASVVSGWNTIAFPSTSVTKDAAYWLAYICDTSNTIGYQQATSEPKRFKAQAYAGGLPNPAGTGFTPTTGNDINAAWGVLVLSPSSISQPLSYGTPKINLSIKPSSLVQPIAYGTPAVATAALIIYPTSIVQSIAIGTPTLRYPQAISPSSIIQSISVGTPWIGIIGIISPQGIVQPVAIGTPTILKYVWHVILDGQYATETPEKNRLFVIGRDQYGNPVWGEAHDATESALVGERLDFQQELAIPTTAQAGDVASAILSKMRLTGKRGVILIPPNCGQELFDVVELSDAGANQSAVKFRVVGIRFEYNPKQARYQHKLMLGAP